MKVWYRYDHKRGKWMVKGLDCDRKRVVLNQILADQQRWYEQNVHSLAMQGQQMSQPSLLSNIHAAIGGRPF